jgi:UDPglucose 6-dehydrogenase
MKVAIIGSGYVGLVTGVGLASIGHQVRCVERDANRVGRINAGQSPIHEAGLEELLQASLGNGSFAATTDLAGSVADADITILAVGTPSDEGRIDLRDVLAASSQIGAALPAGRFPLVVVKSTVVPGTTDGPVRATLEEASQRRAGVDFGLAVNPEFLTEGRAVADFMEPDRIVIGADDEASMAIMRELYARFTGVPLVEVAMRTGEMIKYASNALLATSISFSNELANFAEAVGGIDMLDVMAGLHSSRYLTAREEGRDPVTVELASFLLAGCGFGGSCLPKDVAALVAAGADHGEPMPLLRAVLQINEARAQRILRMLRDELGPLEGRRIGILGIAFKPDTGDVRESPSFPIMSALLHENATVAAHDPVVQPAALADHGLAGVAWHEDLQDLLGNVDAAVLVTSWGEYQQLPELLASMEAPPLLVDGRRMIPAGLVPAYRGIGRG